MSVILSPAYTPSCLAANGRITATHSGTINAIHLDPLTGLAHPISFKALYVQDLPVKLFSTPDFCSTGHGNRVVGTNSGGYQQFLLTVIISSIIVVEC